MPLMQEKAVRGKSIFWFDLPALAWVAVRRAGDNFDIRIWMRNAVLVGVERGDDGVALRGEALVGDGIEEFLRGISSAGLLNFLADCALCACQKRRDETAVSAHDKISEAFEPFSVRHFGVAQQPVVKLAQAFDADFSFDGSRYYVPHQRLRYVSPLNFRHGLHRYGSAAIESVHDLIGNLADFFRVLFQACLFNQMNHFVRRHGFGLGDDFHPVHACQTRGTGETGGAAMFLFKQKFHAPKQCAWRCVWQAGLLLLEQRAGGRGLAQARGDCLGT